MKTIYSTGFILIFTLTIMSGALTVGLATTRDIQLEILEINEEAIPYTYQYKKGNGEVNKYALIIGISDYAAISDLNYCDEDATDWYNYLITLGYQITVLGDSHPENYPQWDGYATEYNVRLALAEILAIADEDDIVTFISSGHGGRSYSSTIGDWVFYLCMWDTSVGENGYNGLITNTELQEMMAPSVANTFIFLDHCFTGGFQNVMLNANAEKVYMTTTCTDNGMGYDDPIHFNGAWTYYFLEYTLIGELGGFASMEETYDAAYATYITVIHKPGDWPMEFDGQLDEAFYL